MSQYKDFWLTTDDGLNLYARDYQCTDQENRSAKTIVCIPGLTRNSADFALLAEHLSARFRILAVDLRGRGKSDYDPRPENYHPGTYCQDILALLANLKLSQVILIGTSLGGLVSMILSATQPGVVLSVVLNDIGPETNPSGLDRIRAYIGDHKKVSNWDEATAVTKKIHAAQFPLFGAADWRAFANNIYRQNADGTPVLDYDFDISVPLNQPPDAQAATDLWPVFEAMSAIPTLLIRGELSDILNQSCVDQMQRTHTKLAYVEVPECGHAPTLNETESRLAIDQFLHTQLS